MSKPLLRGKLNQISHLCLPRNRHGFRLAARAHIDLAFAKALTVTTTDHGDVCKLTHLNHHEGLAVESDCLHVHVHAWISVCCETITDGVCSPSGELPRREAGRYGYS